MEGSFGRSSNDPRGFSYQQTMYRIKDPAVSIPFYTKHFEMTCIAERHFTQWEFSLYFMASLPAGTVLPFAPDSDEAMAYLNQISYTVLELTHNHGTESDP
jgi:lactoylglutathione lyase